MAKPKRKLMRAEKAAKAIRKAQFEIIFINGKQKRVRRRDVIEGMNVEDFIRANADPIWLHQNEMWEYMEPDPPDDRAESIPADQEDETPF
jgi:16S rRNA U516 pseudouridylate synthase RsuA-like enzyme